MSLLKISIKLDKHMCNFPRRAHKTDAGADLISVNDDTDLLPQEQFLFDTGVSVAIPAGFVGLVFNRSSQGKNGLVIPNSVGVIDSDYRGNIKVLLRNISETTKRVAEGDRIAQLVVMPIVLPTFVPFEGTEEEWETSTNRGTGGFGSTGQ